MNRTLAFGFLIAISVQATQSAHAQFPGPRGYPRVALRCPGDLGAGTLREEAPGVFSYRTSHEWGVSYGGEASLKMKADPAKGLCHVTISAGKGGQAVTHEFRWSTTTGDIQPELLTGTSKKEEDKKFRLCDFAKRYSASLGKCQKTTESEPGDKCYNEAAQDLSVTTPFGKIIAYGGGFSLEISPRETGEDLGQGFALFKDPEKGAWCVNDEDLLASGCRKLASLTPPNRFEVKNKPGQIAGVIQIQGEAVTYRPAKPPLGTGVVLDESGPVVQLSVQPEQTQVTISKKGEAPTTLTLRGEPRPAKTFKSYWRETKLVPGQELISDCNGDVPSASANSAQPAARPQRSH